MFGTGLGRLLPAPLRNLVQRWLRPVADIYMAQKLRPFARPPGGPEDVAGRDIAILGIFSSRVGLGQGAELMARLLEAQGARVQRYDVARQLLLPQNVTRAGVRDISELAAGTHDMIVAHVNPPEFFQLRSRLPANVFKGVPLVGVFLWELDRVPQSWRASIACCDQVWTPSSFIAEVIGTTFPEAKPRLRVREYDVVLGGENQPQRSAAAMRAARERLGLDPDAFMVLTSFSMNSTLARKNPIGAVEAFRRAFPTGAEKALHLVRCLDHAAFPGGIEQLEAAAAGDPRVHVVRIGRETSSIEDAYLASDVYLSLHRAEGFGLNLAEALAIGLPVIGTRWSLIDSIASHPLFVGVPSRLVPIVDAQHLYDGVRGARWAEPDLDAAAEALRQAAAKAGKA